MKIGLREKELYRRPVRPTHKLTGRCRRIEF